MFFPDLLLSKIHPEWADHVNGYDVWYRCLGSLWLSLSAASVLALVTDPLRFSVVYVCQLLYKSIWIVTTCLPRAIAGNLNTMDGICAALMATAIVMDYLFLPWGYILNGEIPTAAAEKTTKKAK